MEHIPKIKFEWNRSYSGYILLHKDHQYTLESITFWREASILGPAIRHSIPGNRFPVHPSFELPYRHDDIVIRRKLKNVSRPFILRTRSYVPDFRAGELYLPFDDFQFGRHQETETRGHEQVTKHFYRSSMAEQLVIPVKEMRSEVPELVEEAKEKLTIMLQKETLKKTADEQYSASKADYYHLDPDGKFLEQFKEVSENLDGGQDAAA